MTFRRSGRRGGSRNGILDYKFDDFYFVFISLLLIEYLMKMLFFSLQICNGIINTGFDYDWGRSNAKFWLSFGC
jgi:hypothetical protein